MSTHDDDASVVRHEEQIHVRTEAFPLETVRIEKVIVTEPRTFTIDVRREELRITRRPADDKDTASYPLPHERPAPIVIILREEQVTVTTSIVPVERITVDIVNVIGEQHLRESLQREIVDLEQDQN